jgi:tyrosine-protein phosphatase SIW14
VGIQVSVLATKNHMISNFLTVEPGIYRGGQPDDAGWNQLFTGEQINQVVKLNTEAEASDVAAEALGMSLTYKPIPLAEQIIFEPNYEAVQEAVAAITPGTFIHCEHGQDRTGIIVGCYRVWKMGWSKDKAWAEMLQCGFHVELLGLTLFWKWAV